MNCFAAEIGGQPVAAYPSRPRPADQESTIIQKTTTTVAALTFGFVFASCGTTAPVIPATTRPAVTTTTVEVPGPVTTKTVQAAPLPAVTKTVAVKVPGPTVTKTRTVQKVAVPKKQNIPLNTSGDLEPYDDLYEPETDGSGSGDEKWMTYTSPDWSNGAPKWWKTRIDYYYDFRMCSSITSILNTLPSNETDIRAIILQEGPQKGTCN